jgi:glucose/arabinose dehydrogenase
LLSAACTAGYVDQRICPVPGATLKTMRRGGHHRGRRLAVWSPDKHLVIDRGSVGACTCLAVSA